MSLGKKRSRNSDMSGKRKLVIKNLVKPTIDDKYFEECLQTLSVAVDSIFYNGLPTQPLEKLYKTVSQLCHLSRESDSYSGLYKNIQTHVDRLIRVNIQPFVEEETLLFKLSQTWLHFREKIDLIRAIYLELDRTNVNGTFCYSVLDMALKIVRETLLPNNFVMLKVNEIVLQQIRYTRTGGKLQGEHFKTVIQMFDDLAYFQAKLEPKIFEETKKFFSKQSQEKIADLSLVEYLDYVRTVLKKENDFFKETCPMIVEQNRLILSTELIGEHKDKILHNKNLTTLFEKQKFDLIKQVFTLFQMIPGGVDRLNDVFFVYIRDNGIKIVKKDKEIIQELLDFKEQADNILVQSFNSQEPFYSSIQTAFKKIVNTNYNKIAELIAKYIDSKLRTGCKDINEKQFETLLDKVMIFFRYNDGKDIFEAYYKQYLSKRLLIGKSASVDAEKTMLTKLKIECGQDFTVTLEGMFKDLEVSRGLNEGFSRSLSVMKLVPKIDMIVNTLTESNWPNRPAYDFKLPAVMTNYEEAYAKFYQAKFASRKLSWGRDLGHCLVTFHLSKNNRKELQVSLFQAVILLMFNDREEVSLKDIRRQLFPGSIKPAEEELKRTLQSLACCRKETRILIKVPKGRDVEEDDKFVVNNRLQNNHYRIKINQVQFKETVEEHEKTERHIQADRQTLIDANIVRIMKAKKKLHFNELITEVFSSIKFKATANDVKQRLETLVDRVFVNRDADDPNVIHYEV